MKKAHARLSSMGWKGWSSWARYRSRRPVAGTGSASSQPADRHRLVQRRATISLKTGTGT